LGTIEELESAESEISRAIANLTDRNERRVE